MKHKHYDVIIAFAEGKQIQSRPNARFEWRDCSQTPNFFLNYEYRVKPEKMTRVILTGYYPTEQPYLKKETVKQELLNRAYELGLQDRTIEIKSLED